MPIIRTMQVVVEVLRPTEPPPLTDITLNSYTLSASLTNNLLDRFSNGAVGLGGIFSKTPFNVGAALVSGTYNAGAVVLPKWALDAAIVGGSGNGQAVVPKFSLSATSIAQGFAVGDANLGNLENKAIEQAPWSIAATGVSADWIEGNIVLGSEFWSAWAISATTLSESFSNGDIDVLPYLTVGGSLEPALPYAAYALAGAMLPGSLATGKMISRIYTLFGAMQGGNMAAGDVELEKFEVVAETDGYGGVDYGFRVSGAMLAGAAVVGAVSQPGWTLSATHIHDGAGYGDADLPLFGIAGAGINGGVSVGVATVQKFALAGHAVTGGSMAGHITVPLVEVSGTGYASTVGTATILLPAWTLSATLVAEVAAPVFTTIALNTETSAVTTYTNMEFNSMCRFNGVTLAAGAGGIMALIGEDDNGTAIDAYLAVGASDYGSAQHKRISAGYIGGRLDGQLEITLITDEQTEYSYKLVPTNIGTLHQARKVFGKGLKSRYWAWRLANVNGCDFELDNLSLDIDVLSRRV